MVMLTSEQQRLLIAQYEKEMADGLWWGKRKLRAKQLARLADAEVSDQVAGIPGRTRRGVAGRDGGRVLTPRTPGSVIEGSTWQMPGLWPWTVGGDSPLFGAPLGHHLIHQRPVHFDQLEWFRRGYITAPVTAIIATNGSGKSTLAARLMTYSIATGRCAIACGDVKPDHADRIRALGGQHIRYGLDIINPLSPGALGQAALRLTGAARESLRADMRQSQILNMKTLIKLQRGTDSLGDVESAILAEAIRALNTNPTRSDTVEPELKTLDEILDNPTPEMMYVAVADTTEQYRDQVRDLCGSVRAMLRPDSTFGRMFSGQTTTPLAVDSPGIDIDVSWVPEGDAAARAAAIGIGWTESYATVTATHALADAGLGPRRVFDLYLEELYLLLGAGGTIILDILNREARTNRTKGTTITTMTHSFADYGGAVERDQRETAEAIWEKCQVRIYGRISRREIERLDHHENFTAAEINHFRSLGRNHGLHSSDPGEEGREPPGRGVFLMKLSEDDGAGIPFKVHVPRSQLSLHNTSARLV